MMPTKQIRIFFFWNGMKPLASISGEHLSSLNGDYALTAAIPFHFQLTRAGKTNV
jgi:hypothetical protein